jgi:GntR family transcriptional regulator, arabinose operon transcriptional repressor
MEIRGGQPPYLAVAERLLSDARSQQLTAGARLPSVRELSARYSVAKATVQQAMRQLEREGLLYTIQRKGVFLAKDPPAPTPETATVALVLNYERLNEETNPFYRSLFEGAENEAVRRKHNVLLLYEWSRKSPLQKNREVEQFRRQLGGFLALGLYDEHDCLRLRASSVPVVVVDYETLDLGIDCVVIDNLGAMRLLCERVLQQRPGRTFLVDLARSRDYDPAVGERHQAFHAAMAANGRDAGSGDDHNVILLDNGRGRPTETGNLLAAVAAGGRPPAVICTDEFTARQLLEELGSEGPQPDRDFLLAYLGHLKPQHPEMRKLPAIIYAIDFSELGREGMRLLGERIENGPGRAIRRTVSGTIIEWRN